MEIQKASAESSLGLLERQSHRLWIAGRILTLLSHYWREDDPSAMDEAIARDWADVLEGMPQTAIEKSCKRYLRDEPRRKPTPGAIYALARSFIPAPVIVHRAPEPEPMKERLSAERAEEIMAEVGFRPQKFGGTQDE